MPNTRPFLAALVALALVRAIPAAAENHNQGGNARAKAQALAKAVPLDLQALAKALAGAKLGNGAGISAAAVAGAGGGGFMEGLRFGGKIHFYCGPFGQIATDVQVNGNAYTVQTSAACNAKGYAGGVLSVGVSASTPEIEAGLTQTYSFGVDDTKFGKNGATVINAMKKEVEALGSAHLTLLAATIDHLRGKNGAVAPAAAALVNLIGSLVTTQTKANAVAAGTLVKNPQVGAEITKLAGTLAGDNDPPSLKKILEALQQDMTKDPALAGVARVLGLFAEMLTGCDNVGMGVSAGAGFVPITGTLSYSHYSEIGTGIAVDKLLGNANDNRKAALLALVSPAIGLARKGSDVMRDLDAGEKETLRLAAASALSDGFAENCVLPALAPMCRIATDFAQELDLPLPKGVFLPLGAVCGLLRQGKKPGALTALKAANLAAARRKAEEKDRETAMKRAEEARKKEAERQLARDLDKPWSPRLDVEDRRYRLSDFLAANQALDQLIKKGELDPRKLRVGDKVEREVTVNGKKYFIAVKRTGPMEVRIEELYPLDLPKEKRIELPIALGWDGSKVAKFDKPLYDPFANDLLDDTLAKLQLKLVGLRKGESLKGKISLKELGLDKPQRAYLLGKDGRTASRKYFDATHVEYEFQGTADGRIRILEFRPTTGE